MRCVDSRTSEASTFVLVKQVAPATPATEEYAVRCFTAKDPHGDRVYLSQVLQSCFTSTKVLALTGAKVQILTRRCYTQWRSVHPLPTEVQLALLVQK